jgi:hypothetical protein
MSNEDQNKFDFSGHMTHIEDAENVELPRNNKTFTDTELEQAGLVKTSAFVRTKRSKNALRIEKHKQKKEEIGIKQLNIEVSEQHREAMKAIAAALKEGKTLQEATQTMEDSQAKPGQQKTKTILPEKTPEQAFMSEYLEFLPTAKKVAQIVAEGGLRAYLLKILVK